MIELAAAAGMSWNAHSWSSAINTAASLHLAAASANVLVLELKPVPSPMQHELVPDPIVMVDGFIAVRDRPGLFIAVDDAAVRRYVFDWRRTFAQADSNSTPAPTVHLSAHRIFGLSQFLLQTDNR